MNHKWKPLRNGKVIAEPKEYMEKENLINYMGERLEIIALFLVFPIMFIVFMALPFIVVYLTNTPWDTEVNPELFSGILASSGILFGLWAILVGDKKEIKSNSHYGRAYKLAIEKGQNLLVLNVISLIVSVFSLLFFVTGQLQSIFTLCILIDGFNYNALSFILKLFLDRSIEWIEH